MKISPRTTGITTTDNLLYPARVALKRDAAKAAVVVHNFVTAYVNSLRGPNAKSIMNSQDGRTSSVLSRVRIRSGKPEPLEKRGMQANYRIDSGGLTRLGSGFRLRIA